MFCGLAIVSYFHIKPWRRHPSPLIMQICLMSLCISIVFVANTTPFGRVNDLSDGGDVNIIGSSDYDSGRDGTAGCIFMSLIMQTVLLAREAWILTLSIDLVTSITNPFSSHVTSQRHYHLFVWLVAISMAVALVNHRQCQGEFLSNGTCWIRIDGIESGCFWGYFFSWMILFYLNSAAVLFYAYTRISKGLESTYATRYACVADTFRVVFFYFSYGVLLAVLLLVLYYAHARYNDGTRTRLIQHIVGYLVACRGFFDALVWFFTHGFICSQDSVTGFALNSPSPVQHKQLTMRDIFQPKFLISKMYETWRRTLQSRDSVTTRDTEQLSSLLLPSQTRLPFKQDDGEDDEDDGDGALATSSSGGPRSVPTMSTSSSMSPATMDFDVSPQLNLALRKEVLDLVTMGIKESVQRMQQRHCTVPSSPLPDHQAKTKEPESVSESSLSSLRSIYTHSSMQSSVLGAAGGVYTPRMSNASAIEEGRGMNLPKVYVPPAAPAPNMVQSFLYNSKSSTLSSALHGLLSVVGTHLPGEYGVDTVAYREDSQSIRASMLRHGEVGCIYSIDCIQCR